MREDWLGSELYCRKNAGLLCCLDPGLTTTCEIYCCSDKLPVMLEQVRADCHPGDGYTDPRF